MESNNLLGRRFLRVFIIIVDIILALALIVLIAVLILRSTYSLCRISGESMMNTLQDGQYALISNNSENLSRGDIFVFSNEDDGETTQLIKRAIAMEGDTVEFKRTDASGSSTRDRIVALYVNGELADESSYILEPMYESYWSHSGLQIRLDIEYTVPNGAIFALGDNRNNSLDSRYASVGYVELDSVAGRVECILEQDSFLEWLVTLIYGVPFRDTETA